MANNYFEHEIQVKYVDNLLSKSQNWDWLIEYIEENFDIDLKIASADEFDIRFIDVNDIFSHLKKINEFVDELKINKEWLNDINQLSLFSLGKIDLNSLNLKNDFIKLFALYIFSAKIINEKSEIEYNIYSKIFKQKNLFEIIDTSQFSLESDVIFKIIDSLELDFSKEKSIFENNINGIFFSCSTINESLLAACNNPNSFSFSNRFIKEKTETWQEEYLLDFLSVNCENRKFIPKITYSNGSSYPDFNIYTPEIISKLKNYYKDTEIIFLLESIEYILHDKKPSQKTIDKHFELLFSNIKEHREDNFYHLKCSSLEFVLCFFEDTGTDTNEKKADYFKELSQINNIQYFLYLQNRKAPISKQISQQIKEYRIQKANEIDSINDIQKFHSYIEDAEIIPVVDTNIFHKVSDKFEIVIEEIDQKNNVLLASSFLGYLLFLIKIKNNRGIVASEISPEIIYIRSLWQEKYFNVCFKSMACFENSLKIHNEDIEKFNTQVLERPLAIACQCLCLNKDLLIKKLESTSSSPFTTLFTNIIINEDFPYEDKICVDNKHPNDLIFKDFLEKIHDENRYRFLNSFSIEEYMRAIYKDIKVNLEMYFSFFNKTEELYNIACKCNNRYSFIEFSTDISLAHLTQFFPVVETKIREMGEVFGISPICEKEDKYYNLKEPSSVLNKIIEFIYNETGDLSLASDFFFIHFALFAENGYNIRNECLHGKNFNISTNKIQFALKVTLFCLHLLEKRLDLIRKSFKQENETE